jgi:NADPH:quinone reductase-like Zn-dependent oxidoreductase
VKAAVNIRYGPPDVVVVREVPKPEPGVGDVLVRVRATTVGRTDAGALRAHPAFTRLFTGLLRPKRTVLGMDFAGEVEAVGPGVGSFHPGERVFGLTPGGYGGHAQYLIVPQEGAIATMPAGMPFAEAVVCEGALYADTDLRALGLGPGNSILIYGGSGAIGSAAVQIAKAYGASVTAVVATRHLELVTSLGADRVIDYTVGDFTAIGETFDFVFDAVGTVSYFRARRLLRPGGRFTATDFGPHNQNLLVIFWCAISRSKRFVFPIPKSTKAFVERLAARMEAGEFRALIDRKYPLEAIVEAYRYVETKQKTGIVVIDLPPE